MDTSQLIHNPAKVSAAWLAPKGTKTIVAKMPCKIYFPKTYVDNRRLGSMDDKFNVLAVFGITVEDKYYGVSDALATMPLTPDIVNIVKIEDADYYELSWGPGSVICPNRFLVRDNSVLYEVFDEFISKGKTPWYMDVVSLSKIFDTAGLHAGASIRQDRAILSIFTSSRAKSSKDRRKYHRETLETQADLTGGKPIIIPLNSVSGTATNTTSNLLGSYMREGVTNALVNPSESREAIEDLLLK